MQLDQNDIQQRMGRVEGALISLGAASEIRADFRHIISQFEVEESKDRIDKVFADAMGGKAKVATPNRHSNDLPLPPPKSKNAGKPKSPEHKEKIRQTMIGQHARKRGDIVAEV